MKIFELTPCSEDGRKSYYGKAKVVEIENGDSVLISYNTEICKITKEGEFKKLWNGYSLTTMRHINSFLATFGFARRNKEWWNKQPIEA